LEPLKDLFQYSFNIKNENRHKTHLHEKGCAIIAAVESGEIDEESYSNFQKMHKEKVHYESDAIERKNNKY